MNDAHLLTQDEVAEKLGLSKRTVRSYVHDGRLRVVKLGESDQAPVRVDPAELDRFVRQAARRGMVRQLRRAIERTRVARASADAQPKAAEGSAA